MGRGRKFFAFLFAVIFMASQVMHLFHSHDSITNSFYHENSNRRTKHEKSTDPSLKISEDYKTNSLTHCSICQHFFNAPYGESLTFSSCTFESYRGFRDIAVFYYFLQFFSSENTPSILLRGPPVI